MPVTAKLSKAFYDQFGHAVVDELVNWLNEVDATYRTELRDLNELNFARFDAKLEQRVAQLDAKFEQRLAQFDAKLEQRLAQSDTKLEQRLAQFEAKFEVALARLEGGLLARIGLVEGRLARLTLIFWVATLGAIVALLKL